MRSLFRVLAGVIAACLVAAFVKVLHVVVPDELMGLDTATLVARLTRIGELILLTAAHQAFLIVPLALIAAIVTEINAIRGLVTYIVLGVLIASAGFYLQYMAETGERTILNSFAVRAYFVEGLFAGASYWLIAGRFAGGRREAPVEIAKPYPLVRPRLRIADVPETEGRPAGRNTT